MQRKNRVERSRGFQNHHQDTTLVERQRAGSGFQHLLMKRDVRTFLGLLPQWEALAEGLDAVLLARGEEATQGWFADRIVAICAWPDDLEVEWPTPIVARDQTLLNQLQVTRRRTAGGVYTLLFSPEQARAYQLLGPLIHYLVLHQKDRCESLRATLALPPEPPVIRAQAWPAFSERFHGWTARAGWNREWTA